ncbi:hypothetical protein K431DRAFT_253099 [Polychaeton citri CBS 116435]|uniref:SMODS and SLOG-associating 2TM effector domain-containing protein n=1 Tax=Polychaeton citri CBS 116435 TaxID=1314669 RepID=A0A9P4Q5I6_9PEZI|nr:hypothetical protein K431DRAFT_253099 [Polychaeton citri CBS 116435]
MEHHIEEQRQNGQQEHQDDAMNHANENADVNVEIPGAPHNALQSPQRQEHSISSGSRAADSDPATSRPDDSKVLLESKQFLERMGMCHFVVQDGHNYPPDKDLGLPHGLYKRVDRRLKNARIKYHVFNILTYILLMLQVVLSAIFIILGGLKVDDHVAIAVLGAVGVVISGALALMKGQGLPNRLRQLKDSLENVVLEMEKLYADACAGRKVQAQEVEKVREYYSRILEEARTNHPETFNSSTTGLGPGAGLGNQNLRGRT